MKAKYFVINLTGGDQLRLDKAMFEEYAKANNWVIASFYDFCGTLSAYTNRYHKISRFSITVTKRKGNR